MRSNRLVTFAFGAFVGASVWISLGTLAVVGDDAARVFALPGITLLATLLVVGGGAAYLLRLRGAECVPLTILLLLWLPWLPLQVPAAALLWEGRLEAVVWMAAAAGVTAALLAPHRDPRSQMGLALGRIAVWCAVPSRAPAIASLATLLLSLGAAGLLSNVLPDGDEPHYLVMTQSLLYDGDLQIENNHTRGDPLEYTQAPLPPDFLRRGRNEQIYSVHAPGVSALLVPAYALAGYPGALLLIACVSATAVGVLWRAAYLVTQSAAAAWASTAAVGLSSTFVLHSATIFPDPVGFTITALALLTLLRLNHAAADPSSRMLVCTGAALAALPWLHTRFALVAAVFGAVIGLRLLATGKRWTTLGAFFLFPVIAALGWFAYFVVVYGTLDPTAPYGGSRQTAWTWIPRGAAGLLADQQFGLLANAPVFALTAVGAVLFAGRMPRVLTEMLLVAVPYCLTVAAFAMWWGGWSGPARFLLVLLPLAVPLLAIAWQGGGRGLRSAFVALTALGALNTIVRVWVDEGTRAFNGRDGYDVLLDWTTRHVDLPLALPALHRGNALEAFLVAMVWLGFGMLPLVLSRVLRSFFVLRPSFFVLPATGSRWTLATWAVAAVICASATTSWRMAEAAPITRTSSQLAFVARWQPSLRPLTGQLTPTRLSAAGTVLPSLAIATSTRGRDVMATPRPRAAQGRAVIVASDVPAGIYELLVPAASPQGPVSVWSGFAPGPVESYADVLGHTPRLDLPVEVRALSVHASSSEYAAQGEWTLRPLQVDVAAATKRPARAGVRYGNVRVFQFDEQSHLEATGLWTIADSSSEVFISPDDPHRDVTLTLLGGPVPTVVTLTSGGRELRVDVLAGTRVERQLPSGQWRIHTRGGFRPVDYDPRNLDARPLGVWLTVRQ